ncbi:MAG: cell division ATP-binding protein FtsE [Pseudomonadota bacterium]|jgi:cell division transport system ATP-binding protein|nr:ATP-binding cassette domain-containing protein [Alphaproteobacteria bacterium]
MSNSEFSPLIQFQNVSFSYSHSAQEILKNVSISFNSHAFYFLTGDSGSGKSSFLKLMYNELLPTHGSINVLGVDTRNLTIQTRALFRQQIGIVLQECELFDHLNVEENVALVLKLQGISSKKAKTYTKDLLDWAGLGDYLHYFPKQLSAGQKQRVAVARAVIRKPKILLADEPTGNVDDVQSKRLMDLFKELVKTGTTIIMTTHNRQLVNSSDCFQYILHHGKIKQTNELRNSMTFGENAERFA